MANRKITIYSTLSGNTVIETNANTWGELQADLKEHQIKYTDMKAIVADTQNTLESPEALLPVNLNKKGVISDDFTLFLTPVKVKSGAGLSYKDAKALIKEIKANNKEADAHFGNYTHDSTETLNNKIDSWTKKAGKTKTTTAKQVQEPVKKLKTQSEKPIKESKEVKSDDSEVISLLKEIKALLTGSNTKTGKTVIAQEEEPKKAVNSLIDGDDDLAGSFRKIKGNFPGVA